MGLINFGVPEKEVTFLKEKMKLDLFVEGGTYHGNTAKNMSEKFKNVITIEKSDVMYSIAKDNLKEIENIVILKGDTREHLDEILKNNDNILFWLDAHWSGGETYGKEDECPLLEELQIIFEYNKNYVILIDDARLFLAPPPKPHIVENWPSLVDIIELLPKGWKLIEFEDVLYIFPKRIQKEFTHFIQEETTDRWIKYSNGKVGFLKKVKTVLSNMIKGQ